MLAVVYAGVWVQLVTDWLADDGESYGILVPPLALYLVWLKRGELARIEARVDARGIWMVGGACLLYLAGFIAAEFFLMRVSFVLAVAGLIATFGGFARLKALLLPVLLLLTALPLPSLLYNRISIPLQLLSSVVSAELVQALGISVYLEGNVLYLNRITLGVAEACNGLRSLSSLLVLGLIIGFVQFRRPLSRALMVFLVFPIALSVNVLRVSITAILANSDPVLATGFYHVFSGWLVFVAGIALVWAASGVVQKFLEKASSAR